MLNLQKNSLITWHRIGSYWFRVGATDPGCKYTRIDNLPYFHSQMRIHLTNQACYFTNVLGDMAGVCKERANRD